MQLPLFYQDQLWVRIDTPEKFLKNKKYVNSNPLHVLCLRVIFSIQTMCLHLILVKIRFSRIITFVPLQKLLKSGKDWIDNLFNKFWKFLSWLQYSSNISIPGAKLRHFTEIECFKKSSIFTLSTLTVKSVFN